MMNTISASVQMGSILPQLDLSSVSTERCHRLHTAGRYRVDRRYDGRHDAQQIVSNLMAAHRQ